MQVNLFVSGDAQGPRQEAEGLEGKVLVRVENSRLVKRVSDSAELCNSLQKKLGFQAVRALSKFRPAVFD